METKKILFHTKTCSPKLAHNVCEFSITDSQHLLVKSSPRWCHTRATRIMTSPEEPFPLLPICSGSTVAKMKNLPLRPSDVFVTSYPKSGTTWMQHIVHTLATDGNSPLPHVSDACPFYDVDRTWSRDTEEPVLAAEVVAKHDQISRRIFNTHLRWEMMPKDHPEARYIYMTRRPQDACVSFYHHLSHQNVEDGGFAGSLDDFVRDWTGGTAIYGSWSAHLKSWLGVDGASNGAADPRVLVLSYEELRADLRAGIGKVNTHCRFGLSDARLDDLCERFTFASMRANEAQFEPRSVRWTADESEPDGKFHFIRAGRVGDGDACFASEERKAALAVMVARTFPAGTPEHIAKLLG